MSKAKLLYVEDDETLSFVTKDNLELNGYEVIHSKDGQSALDLFAKDSFDLAILDVMLPHMDGFTLAGEIRKKDGHIPILFLTAKSLKEDKLKGLSIGGDDYITKPFSIEELILRIEVFLKRKYVNKTEATNYEVGEYELDHPNLILYRQGEIIKKMTQKECDLLQLLIINKNQTLKRSEILKRLWGEDDYFLGRSMDVFISRLRKYLGQDERLKIENVHGVGFRLIEEETTA